MRPVQHQFSARWLLRSRGFLLLHQGKLISDFNFCTYLPAASPRFRVESLTTTEEKAKTEVQQWLLSCCFSGLSGTMGHAVRRLRGIRGGRRGDRRREACVSSELFPLPKMPATVTGTGNESVSRSRYTLARALDSARVDCDSFTVMMIASRTMQDPIRTCALNPRAHCHLSRERLTLIRMKRKICEADPGRRRLTVSVRIDAEEWRPACVEDARLPYHAFARVS